MLGDQCQVTEQRAAQLLAFAHGKDDRPVQDKVRESARLSFLSELTSPLGPTAKLQHPHKFYRVGAAAI